MPEREKILVEVKAKVFKALGHPIRLWMAERLAAGELCVCELLADADVKF
jgi:ArsR family transcriptional regulator